MLSISHQNVRYIAISRNEVESTAKSSPAIAEDLQNAAVTRSGPRQLNSTHHLQLREGQTYLLDQCSDQRRCVQIACEQGVARLAVGFDDTFPEVTLAFCGDPEGQWLRLPQGVMLMLEAVSPCNLRLHYAEHCPEHHDLLMQWLIALHLVRHPVGTEPRLVALFQLLVMHFGIRRSDGYLLPFSIAHSRLAELIGATRSTVTRQINGLRQQGDLQLTGSGGLLFSDRLIEQKPIPRLC
jgi:hypothetical protein